MSPNNATERPAAARVLGQSLFGFVGMALHKGSSFALVLLLARGLSAEDFGVYSYVGVLLLMVGWVADLGLERVLVRELARQPQHAALLLGHALLLRIGLGCIAVAVGFGVLWSLGLSDIVRDCFLLGLAVFPLGADAVGRAYYQFRLQIDRFYLLTLASSLLFLSMVAVCLFMRWPLPAIFVCGLANAVVLNVAVLTWLLRDVGFQWGLRKNLFRLLLSDAAHLGTLGVLFLVAMRIDQVLLFRWRDAQELARYAAAVRLVEACSLVPDAVTLALLPVMAAAYHSRPTRYRRLRGLAFRYLGLVAVPLVLIGVVAGSTLLGGVFGSRFAQAGAALSILSVTLLFSFTGSVFLNEFLIARWLRSMVLVSAVTVVTNVALNTLWIPSHGAAGAAAATLASSAVGFACWLALPFSRPTMLACVRELGKPVLAGALGLLLAKSTFGAGWVAALLAVSTYVVLLFRLRAIGREDVARLVRALQGVRPSWA